MRFAAHPALYRVVAEVLRPDVALSQGSESTIAAGRLGGRRGFTKLVDGYLNAWHRDHPESGCGVARIAADVSRADGSARAAYTHQVRECLSVLAGLIDNADRQVGEHEAVFTLSVLVGAISMARAVDNPDLSQQILTNAAVALKSASRTSGLSSMPARFRQHPDRRRTCTQCE